MGKEVGRTASIAQQATRPEPSAEVLVNRMASYYFNVLAVLDSASPNAVHKVR